MQTIYARFNRQRLPRFQVATFIRQDDVRRMAVKQALTDEARGHLQHMRQAHRLMAEARTASNIVIPAVLEDFSTADSLAFEYIDAPSLDQILHQALCDNDAAGFWSALDDYRRLLTTAFGALERAVITAPLRGIFGADIAERLGTRAPCTGIAFMDPVFENVLVRGADRVFIDNEWVQAGALPAGFAVFRGLYYFFKVKYAPFNIERTVNFEDALRHCDISTDDAALYRAMDESFQTHVFGTDHPHAIPDRYARYAHTSLASMEQTIEHQRQVVRELHGEIAAMRNTLGWRALEILRRGHAFLRNQLFPRRGPRKQL